MTVEIKTLDKHTVVIGGRKFKFDQRVQETLAVGDRVLVLLNGFDFAEDDPEGGRNVFAYDAGGKLLWRIEDAGFTALGKDGQEVPQGYTAIWMEERELKADQPIGCECTIDIETIFSAVDQPQDAT